jgi:signal transduction histidine kinase
MAQSWESTLERLRVDFQTRETELEVLRRLDIHLLEEDPSLEATCAFVLKCVAEVLKAEFAQVLLRRHDKLEVIATIPPGVRPDLLVPENCVTGWCALHGKAVRIGNVRTDRPFAGMYKEFQTGSDTPKMMSELAVPISLGGVTVGVLNVESPQENAFDEHSEVILMTIAGQAALAFKKVRLFREAEVFSQLQQHLLSDSQAADVAIQSILGSALTQLQRYLGDVRHFQILFKEEDQLVVAYSSSGKDNNVRVKVTECVSGEAVQQRRSVLVSDVTKHPKYVGMLGDLIKSEMAVPIIIQGDVTGVLNFESERLGYFDAFSEVLVQNFSSQIAWLLTLLKLRFELSARMKADRANKILQAMGDKTGNLVHRLKNVLGPIKNNAEELLLHHGTTLAGNAQVIELIEIIRDRAEEALKLPDQMRKMFVEVENVDVNAVTAEILRDFRTPPGVTVRTSLASKLPRVKCQGLGAVLQTLLENAVDAMPEGGDIIVASTTVSFQNLAAKFVEISVSDEGTGIPNADQDRIFDWGFSTKATRDKGLGWGLAWVKTFVERSDGSVRVESTWGAGSTFRIRFPAVTNPSGERK